MGVFNHTLMQIKSNTNYFIWYSLLLSSSYLATTLRKTRTRPTSYTLTKFLQIVPIRHVYAAKSNMALPATSQFFPLLKLYDNFNCLITDVYCIAYPIVTNKRKKLDKRMAYIVDDLKRLIS